MMSFKQTLLTALCVGALFVPEYVSAMDMSEDAITRSCLRPKMNCCAELEADFNGTFSELIDIKAELVADFNGTFSMLEALLACPCAAGSCDLNGAFTMLVAIETTLVADFNGTFSVLADLEALIIDDFNGTFSELIDIKTELVQDFNGTFSMLEEILIDIGALAPCGTPISITQADVGPAGYVISAPGVYCLAEDIAFAPIAPGTTAITIAARNVYLDLSEHTIQQVNNTALCTAISLTSNNSNIAIVNGYIRNFSQFGIQLNRSSFSIAIDHVNILQTGFSLDATVAASDSIALVGDSVRDLLVTNCQFSFGQTVAVTSDYGFAVAAAGAYIQNSTDVLYENCQSSNIIAPNASRLAGFCDNNSETITYLNCQSNAHTDGGSGLAAIIAGFTTIGTFDVILRSCVANNLIAKIGMAAGFEASDSKNIIMTDCSASSIVSGGALPSAGAAGFSWSSILGGIVERFNAHAIANLSVGNGFADGGHFINFCSSIVCRDSQADVIENFSGGEASGFSTTRNDQIEDTQFNIVFDHCTVQTIIGSTITTGPNAIGAAGFRVYNLQLGYVDACIANNAQEFSVGTNAYGLNVDGSTINLAVSNSQFDNNKGYGIFDDSTGGAELTAGLNRYHNNWAQNNDVANFSIPNLTGTFMETSYTTLLTTATVNPFTNVAVPTLP